MVSNEMLDYSKNLLETASGTILSLVPGNQCRGHRESKLHKFITSSVCSRPLWASYFQIDTRNHLWEWRLGEEERVERLLL